MLIQMPYKKHQEKNANFLVKTLGLKPEQEKKFFQLDKEHRTKMIQYDDEILELKKSMFNSFSNSEVINESIFNRVGELETNKEKEVFSFFKKIKTFIDKDQVKKLEGIISRAIMHSGAKSQKPLHKDMPPPRDGMNHLPRN